MMRIGILLVGRASEDLVNQYGTYAEMLVSLIDSEEKIFEFKTFNILDDEFPEDHLECDGWIITGSPHGVYEELPWMKIISQLINDIYNAGLPLFGVCFGHQLIAQVLGGEAKVAESGWTVGNQTYDLIEDIPWLKEDITLFTLLHSHKDQVSKLPDKATLISSTEKVPIAYVHDVATIRKEVLGDEVYLAAVENLKNKVPDNEMIAKCWVDFFRRKN